MKIHAQLVNKATEVSTASRFLQIAEKDLPRPALHTPKMDLKVGDIIGHKGIDRKGKPTIFKYRVLGVYPHVIYCENVVNHIRTSFQNIEYFCNQVVKVY